MEDSGVTSFGSSGNVDISLDALEISESTANDASSVSCNDSLLQPSVPTSAAAMPVGSVQQETTVENSGAVAKSECFPAELGSGDMQSDQKQMPIAQLLSKTGYSIVQANGQRRYGPPPDWDGQVPQRGCEVFVGKIPRDCFEDELVPVFMRVGRIYELRLMLDHYTGLNRGYCFVVFSCSAEAKECVRQLNNYEIRKGRSLGICMSVDNCRLFVGGIPKKVNKEDIFNEMRKVTDGVVDVIVYPSASDKSKNRGFAFVEYESHRSAAMARRKLMNGRVDLWGHNIAVDWAEPELEVDEEIMAQVKVLYVRNLMLSTAEVQILEAFSVYGTVERVKKIKDYAFVHFKSKEEAHKAMEAMNGTVLDGAQVEVTLAKPVDKDTYMRSPKLNRACNGPAFYVPVDQYGSILPCYPSYYSPPRYMLRNSMGACTMVQMPRTPPNQHQRAITQGVRTPGTPGGVAGGGATAGGGGGVFYPVSLATSTPRIVYPPNSLPPSTLRATAVPFYPSSPQVYYEQPLGVAKRSPDQETVGMAVPAPVLEVSSPSAATSAPIKATKTCSMLLEEICQKNNWGSPIYSLHSSTSSTPSGEPDTLFLYKATIVGIGMTYIPSKLCRNLSEAREIAAEHALIQLGYPMEATTFPGAAAPRPAAAIQYTSDTATPSFVAITSPPKPGTWATPTDHTPTIYAAAAPYSESPFPAPPFSPEFYQPGPGY